MSAILSTDDLNDFIAPSVACVKPIETLPTKSQADDLEISFNDNKSPSLNLLSPTQISLTDCLACSGCVTSAETVLVSLQSHIKVIAELDSAPALRISSSGSLENLEQGGKLYIASVSPQSRASLAATFAVTEREAGYMIEQLLSGPKGIKNTAVYRNYFQWVIDTNAARNIHLVLGADEAITSSAGMEGRSCSEETWERRLKEPILTSSCPGWICYAEKTHPHVLPHLSKLKSPQALTGTMLKTILSKKYDISTDRIWHVAIMPCLDKKLEASREELTDISWKGSESKGIRDVDLVMTTKELLMLGDIKRVNFANLPRHPVPRTPFPDSKLDSFFFPSNRQQLSNGSSDFGPSGGSLYYILNLFVSQNQGSKLNIVRGRNTDIIEYSVVAPNNKILMRAARYYGFRNIQNLVRRLKPPKQSRMPSGNIAGRSRKSLENSVGPEYSYIEVMACPGGCTNGGGQIRLDDPLVSSQCVIDVTSRLPSPKEWLSKVDEAYFSSEDALDEIQSKNERHKCVDKVSPLYVKEILAHWADVTGIELAVLVYTTFRKVRNDVGKKVDHNQKVMEIISKKDGGW